MTKTQNSDTAETIAYGRNEDDDYEEVQEDVAEEHLVEARCGHTPAWYQFADGEPNLVAVLREEMIRPGSFPVRQHQRVARVSISNMACDKLSSPFQNPNVMWNPGYVSCGMGMMSKTYLWVAALIF